MSTQNKTNETAAAAPEAPQDNQTTLEIEYDDGTNARWLVPSNLVDAVSEAIESILGRPDTLT